MRKSKPWDEIQAEGAHLVGGDARRLPFQPAHFDLVFSQLTTLWIDDVAAAVREVWRVLMADGVWIALAPDYDGMMEHPPEIATRANCGARDYGARAPIRR